METGPTLAPGVLGATGEAVGPLGLGGNRLLATPDREQDATRLIEAALDLGVTFFDTARAYVESERYLGRVLSHRRRDVFLASKTHARDRAGALAQLDESLRRLRTDYLDLWQIHDLRTVAEVDEIFGPRGAIEALVEAKASGRVRYLGVTGHRAPDVIRRCIEWFDFDTVLVPVNPAERFYRSFLDSVIPEAAARGMGIIGMYLYWGGRAARLAGFDTVEPFLRFALSQEVSTVLVGCDSPGQLRQNVEYAARFQPMTTDEMAGLTCRIAPFWRGLMYYKF